MNGFVFTLSFSHKKERVSEKHTADVVLPWHPLGCPSRYARCVHVDLLIFSIIWRERSARMAFFDMRTCPHIGPKLACRRPGTKYCVDLFFYFRTLWNTPSLMLLFLPLLRIPKQLQFPPLGRDLRPNMFIDIESEERTRGETSSTTRIALVP